MYNHMFKPHIFNKLHKQIFLHNKKTKVFIKFFLLHIIHFEGVVKNISLHKHNYKISRFE
jgi:hypothetical protein